MSVSHHTSHYFLLTPSRLARISAASRSIFGHLGSASPYIPNTATRRSPRPYLHRKMKDLKIANWDWPHIQPQLLEGRIWRHQEEQDERRLDKFVNDRQKEQYAEDEKAGRIVKKKTPVLKKGRRKNKEE